MDMEAATAETRHEFPEPESPGIDTKVPPTPARQDRNNFIKRHMVFNL